MKKLYLKCTLPLILLVFNIVACEEDDGLKGVMESFYYEETYCDDPWELSSSASDEVLIARVSEYLHDPLGVDYSDLRITHDGTQQDCSACSCTTGRILRIQADKAYQDILTENGFKLD